MPSHPGVAITAGAFLLALLLFRWRLFRPFSAGLLGLGLALSAYQARIDDRLAPELAGQIFQVSGQVGSIAFESSELLRFNFNLLNNNNIEFPERLLLSWYRDAPSLAPGETWMFEVRLRPPWGSVNFIGPDRERWLFSAGIGAVGSVRKAERLPVAENSQAFYTSMQEAVRKAIRRQVHDGREQGVIQALATADRSAMSRDDGLMLRNTGTAHLLAISGLHIGLAAIGGIFLGRGFLLLLPLARLGLTSYYLPFVIAFLAASLYAVLAGLGISTLRALLMLWVLVCASASARAIHAGRSFVIALALVLAINPLAPLASGFWFSFLAVMSLLVVFQPRTARLSRWMTPVFAQSAVFLVLLPAGAAWFNGFSLLGFFANLLAIPWVSMLVVPPVLLGIVALPASEFVAGALWSLAGISLTGLFRLLEVFHQFQPQLTATRFLPLPLLMSAMLGSLLLLLPRGLPFRWLGAFMLLPLFLPARDPVGTGTLRVDAMDVGQGTAIAVSSKNRQVLYDTGPGDGQGRDHLASSIAPLLRELGKRQPDLLVISHGDLDHSGGLYSFQEHYDSTPVLGSMQSSGSGVGRCTRGDSWTWDGFTYRVLHPSGGLPYLRNNSSCVLSISNASSSILLAGDIEDFVERRLLAENLQQHTILLAPHHGSKSSSSPAFITQVDPSVAIATASLGNRFGFPRETVRERYRSRDIPLWGTGECGALKIVVDSQGRISASSARNERRRIWRWPAAENCP